MDQHAFRDLLPRTLRGEEKLSIVVFAYLPLWMFLIGAIGLIVSTKLGTVLGLLFFVWLGLALWRCAFNTSERLWGFIARLCALGIFAALARAAIAHQSLLG